MIKFIYVFIILLVSVTSFKLRYDCSFDYNETNLNVKLSFKELNFLSNHQPKFVFDTTVYDLDYVVDNESGIKYMRAILEPKGMSNISFQVKDSDNNFEFVSVKAPGYNIRYFQNYYINTFINPVEGLTKSNVTKQMILNGVQNPSYNSFLEIHVGNTKRKAKCVITDGEIPQTNDVIVQETPTVLSNDRQSEINNALNQEINNQMTNNKKLVL